MFSGRLGAGGVIDSFQSGYLLSRLELFREFDNCEDLIITVAVASAEITFCFDLRARIETVGSNFLCVDVLEHDCVGLIHSRYLLSFVGVAGVLPFGLVASDFALSVDDVEHRVSNRAFVHLPFVAILIAVLLASLRLYAALHVLIANCSSDVCHLFLGECQCVSELHFRVPLSECRSVHLMVLL